MLGLKRGQNTLAAPDPTWARAFEEERNRLQPALAEITLAIEHYGSTSVPELKAKPIIDILVGVAALDCWTLCLEPLERFDYRYFPDAGVTRHRVFLRGNDVGTRTHLLHVVEFGSSQWTLNLGFRDRLRRDPLLRQQYQAEKERAALQAPCDRLAYNALKSRFIQGVMADLEHDRIRLTQLDPTDVLAKTKSSGELGSI